MILGLQRHQRLRAEPDRLIEQRDVEIGDTDVAGKPVALGLGQRRHGFGERNVRVRPVHHQQVDVIDPERGRAYSHLWDGATVAIDLAAREVVATWPNGCGGSRGIALDAERGFLIAACQEGKLVLLDLDRDGEKLAEVWPVDGSDVIDYDPDRRHLYTSGQVSASLAIVGVSSAGHMAVLGEDDAALGSHCVVGDGQGGVYLCDPDGGRILVRDDPFDPITE